MAMVLKTIVAAMSPWVRIPRPPLDLRQHVRPLYLEWPDGRRTNAPGPKIRKLFRLTGLDRRIRRARTLDEAREALEATT
jgi:hypothetical protein